MFPVILELFGLLSSKLSKTGLPEERGNEELLAYFGEFGNFPDDGFRVVPIPLHIFELTLLDSLVKPPNDINQLISHVDRAIHITTGPRFNCRGASL